MDLGYGPSSYKRRYVLPNLWFILELVNHLAIFLDSGKSFRSHWLEGAAPVILSDLAVVLILLPFDSYHHSSTTK